MTEQELNDYVFARVNSTNPNDLITPKEVRDSILAVATYVKTNYVGFNVATGDVSIAGAIVAGGNISGYAIVASNSFQLNGKMLAYSSSGSNTINARVISNSTFYDGMYIGFGSMSSGPTRIYDGGTSNNILLSGGQFVSLGINRWVFGGVDDGTYFQVNGAVKMKNDACVVGNLGVGMTAMYRLDINGTARVTTPTGVSFENVLYMSKAGGYGDSSIENYYSSGANYGISLNPGLSNRRFVINQLGYIGLGGIENPTNLLSMQADGNLNTRAINIFSGTSNAGGYVSIGSQYHSTNNYVASEIRFGNELAGNTPSFLAFATSIGGTLTEQMRIASNGNVSIGSTVNAGYKFDVNGSARVQGAVTFAGAVHRKFRILTGGAATYSINSDDETILIESGAGTTLTLPDPVTVAAGRVLRYINRTGSSVGTGRAFWDLAKAAQSTVGAGKSVTFINEGSVWSQIV